MTSQWDYQDKSEQANEMTPWLHIPSIVFMQFLIPYVFLIQPDILDAPLACSFDIELPQPLLNAAQQQYK